MNPRLALLALGYAALIAYASLYPFSWRATGADPLGFLSGQWAVVAPNGDNFANVLAYLPLGLLLALCLSGVGSFALRVILATLAGVALSFSMEFLQQYVPTRVPSEADLATNACGALIGALSASWFDGTLLPGRLLAHWRARWVKADRQFNLGLVAIAAWALSQWLPGVPSLSISNLRAGLAPAWHTVLDPSTFDFLQWGRYTLYISGLALLVRTLGNPGRPAVPMFFLCAAAVLAYKIPVVGRALSLEAVAGLLSAVALTALWLALRMRTVAGIAALFVVGGLVFAHVLPGQASAQHLSHWAPLRGPIDHVVLGLASALEILWPPAALGYLVRIASPLEHRRAVAWGGAALLAIVLAALDLHARSIPYVTIFLMAGTWTLFGLLFLEHPAQQALRPNTQTRQISSRRARVSAAMLACALLTAMLVDEARATPIRVGPQHALKAPSAAAKVARDGDLIEIEAGLYAGDAAVWRQSGLTIRGIGGLAHLRADGAHAEGKAIWVIKGANTTIENIEFSGAKVADRNGAGIRLEGANLTVRNCKFHDNENGILTAPNSESDIVIERSEFAHNGFGDGQSHNLYIGTVRSFTLRHSYVHHAVVGHNVKSRALKNVIEHNRIMDERDGRSSYAIDLPDGGLSLIVGNVLQQGPQTENKTLVAYGAEQYRNPDRKLHVISNTLVNDAVAGGRFLFVRAGAPDAEIVNNIFSGPGTLPADSRTVHGNVRLPRSRFRDPDNFDFRLR